MGKPTAESKPIVYDTTKMSPWKEPEPEPEMGTKEGLLARLAAIPIGTALAPAEALKAVIRAYETVKTKMGYGKNEEPKEGFPPSSYSGRFAWLWQE